MRKPRLPWAPKVSADQPIEKTPRVAAVQPSPFWTAAFRTQSTPEPAAQDPGSQHPAPQDPAPQHPAALFDSPDPITADTGVSGIGPTERSAELIPPLH